MSLSIPEKGVLKSPSVVVGLSISPYSPIIFWLCHPIINTAEPRERQEEEMKEGRMERGEIKRRRTEQGNKTDFY